MTRQQPRQTKTPAQRAQEAVGVLERRLAKLSDKHAAARADVEALEREIEETELRYEYAQNNPDLPTQQPTTVTEETA